MFYSHSRFKGYIHFLKSKHGVASSSWSDLLSRLLFEDEEKSCEQLLSMRDFCDKKIFSDALNDIFSKDDFSISCEVIWKVLPSEAHSIRGWPKKYIYTVAPNEEASVLPPHKEFCKFFINVIGSNDLSSDRDYLVHAESSENFFEGKAGFFELRRGDFLGALVNKFLEFFHDINLKVFGASSSFHRDSNVYKNKLICDQEEYPGFKNSQENNPILNKSRLFLKKEFEEKALLFREARDEIELAASLFFLLKPLSKSESGFFLKRLEEGFSQSVAKVFLIEEGDNTFPKSKVFRYKNLMLKSVRRAQGILDEHNEQLQLKITHLDSQLNFLPEDIELCAKNFLYIHYLKLETDINSEITLLSRKIRESVGILNAAVPSDGEQHAENLKKMVLRIMQLRLNKFETRVIQRTFTINAYVNRSAPYFIVNSMRRIDVVMDGHGSLCAALELIGFRIYQSSMKNIKMEDAGKILCELSKHGHRVKVALFEKDRMCGPLDKLSSCTDGCASPRFFQLADRRLMLGGSVSSVAVDYMDLLKLETNIYNVYKTKGLSYKEKYQKAYEMFSSYAEKYSGGNSGYFFEFLGWSVKAYFSMAEKVMLSSFEAFLLREVSVLGAKNMSNAATLKSG